MHWEIWLLAGVSTPAFFYLNPRVTSHPIARAFYTLGLHGDVVDFVAFPLSYQATQIDTIWPFFFGLPVTGKSWKELRDDPGVAGPVKFNYIFSAAGLQARLVHCGQVRWQDRTHFFAVSANLMRRILVDYVRLRPATWRGKSSAMPVAVLEMSPGCLAFSRLKCAR